MDWDNEQPSAEEVNINDTEVKKCKCKPSAEDFPLHINQEEISAQQYDLMMSPNHFSHY